MLIDANDRLWLVAHVRLNHERKCAERLAGRGIECYLPIRKELHLWKDRKKSIEKVLTPQMLFVRVNKNERLCVLNEASVSHFYSFPGSHQATIVPEKQMDLFKFMVGSLDDTLSFGPCNFAPGDRVKIIRGPLADLEGEFIKEGTKTKVVIRISDLGCASVDVPIAWVEQIK